MWVFLVHSELKSNRIKMTHRFRWHCLHHHHHHFHYNAATIKNGYDYLATSYSAACPTVDVNACVYQAKDVMIVLPCTVHSLVSDNSGANNCHDDPI